MVVALRALEPRAEEKLRRHFSALFGPRNRDKEIRLGHHARVAHCGEQCAREFIVGQVAPLSLDQPL